MQNQKPERRNTSSKLVLNHYTSVHVKTFLWSDKGSHTNAGQNRKAFLKPKNLKLITIMW